MSTNMMSQRAVQLATRRLAATNSSSLSWTATVFARFSSPVAVATGRHVQYRQAATTSTSISQGDSILAEQRRHRPVSPHLSIYKPQVTWYLSGLNRITGIMMSGPIYLFGIAYLVAPTLGWHLESASIAAAIASWPILVKIAAKAFFAFPFTFHSFNSLRHLMWDTGAGITNKQVIVSGWTCVGISVLTGILLTVF